MGVQIVNHQPDAFRHGKVLIDQQPHLLSKVLFGSLLRDVDVTPPRKGWTNKKQICGTFPFIFRIIARWVAGTGWQRMRVSLVSCTGFRQNTLGDSADRRARRTGPRHPPYARRSRTHAGNAPFLALPRFEVVF